MGTTCKKIRQAFRLLPKERGMPAGVVQDDDDLAWRPDRFGYERLGCGHSQQFPVA